MFLIIYKVELSTFSSQQSRPLPKDLLYDWSDRNVYTFKFWGHMRVQMTQCAQIAASWRALVLVSWRVAEIVVMALESEFSKD